VHTAQPSLEATAVREAVRMEIRSRGLRATPARISTLLFLRGTQAPLTHAEVTEGLEPHGFDKATLFRNLNDLTEVGLIRRTELGDHVWRFEAIDPRRESGGGHPHFVCVDCGAVTCLDRVQLTAGSLRQSEGVGIVTEILLRGHCHACR
jgi:Fur family ferric uptake transcriptional regulator